MSEKFSTQPLELNGHVEGDVIRQVSLASTGVAAGHALEFDLTSLKQMEQLAAHKSGGVKCRFTHPDWTHDGLGRYLGRLRDLHTAGDKLVGDLHLSKSARSSPAGNLGDYVLELAAEDPAALGLSVVVDLQRVWVTSDGQELPASAGRPANACSQFPAARILALYAADLVDEPALNPAGLFSAAETSAPNPQPTPIPLQGEKNNMPEETVQTRLTQLESSLAGLQQKLENTVIQVGGQPPRGQALSMGAGSLAEFQSHFDWLFGAPHAKLPPPELRRADALYRAVTGDIAMQGVFDPSHVAFASATTATLADLAVNAMNKVVLDLYTNLTAYRWYELVTSVQATDGSLQDMQWLQFGGISNLPVVAEGAAYTELAVLDTKETSAFTKYGGYVGITDKMIRNSQIDRLQAVPRALTISAIRTRSAAIASIFTANAGAGPTLAQDSTALFHANHANLATTAYSWTAWKAARLECAKQAELGSSKVQVLWPRFLLVPVDLYDQALIDFGYGAGSGGRPATADNDVNPYALDRPGDPRPTVVPVPEWTDSNDWAYIVDPKIAPVICMAYGDNPGGTSHPAPQLYSVTDQASGLLFTNDTLPIKVRDLFAYGVATWRGVGKRNV